MDLAEWVRTKAQRVRNPSRRTPIRETELNAADNVERQLQEDGHKIWGWVIYRCTYEKDQEWEDFMRRLRYYINDTLNFDNALDMSVIEDPALDGALPALIRDHFEQWCATAPQQEQGTAAQQFQRSQRYNYCLHVDQEALRSILDWPEPPEDNLGDGYVNLVCLNAKIVDMRPETIEGRPERDLCWMRITYHGLMVTWYNLFRGDASWFIEYRVPPGIGRA